MVLLYEREVWGKSWIVAEKKQKKAELKISSGGYVFTSERNLYQHQRVYVVFLDPLVPFHLLSFMTKVSKSKLPAGIGLL